MYLYKDKRNNDCVDGSYLKVYKESSLKNLKYALMLSIVFVHNV